MKFRYLFVLILALLLLTTFLTDSYCGQKLPVVNIGFITDGPWIRDLISFPETLLQREIIDLTAGEFDVRFPPDKRIQADWKVDGVKRAIDRLLSDPQVDLIITLGILSSAEVCHRKQLPKPVIAPFVFDPELQGLPLKNGASGVPNLNYVASYKNLETDLKSFREILPFSQLTVLVDELLQNFPNVLDKIREAANAMDISVTILTVGASVEPVFKKISSDTQAVYVTPLLRITPEEFNRLVSYLNSNRIPTFSLWGREEVEKGLLASIAPTADKSRLARRVALNVQRILLGEDAGSINVAFSRGEQFAINMATARMTGVYPHWGILTEAELLNEEHEGVQRQLTLQSAVHEAVKANLELAAEDRRVFAGEHLVREARASLLPQLDLASQGLIIDKDRSEASFGRQPERAVSGSITATQILYSEDAWANYHVQGYLQQSRIEEREALRLDIAMDASIAYLDVLRATTSLRIQRENLKLTRANFERARVRQSIGVSTPAEAFRWESQIANNRRAVIASQARLQQSKNALNRLLHRPLDELFIVSETNLSDPALLVSDRRFFGYVENPKKFKIFGDFLVQEALETAPELRQLGMAIAAQKRIVLAANRAYWLPTFSFQGDVNELLAEGGSGKRDDSILSQNDSEWSVGVFATFPLFSGGEKNATLRRTSEELLKLEIERQAVAERIEERVRYTMHLTSASYPSIQLSRDAAEAAQRNLDLVKDAYARGSVSIITLLDSQHAFLVSDESAQNAVYDFLIDLMRVERAIGKFEFFLTQDDQKSFFQRVDSFFKKADFR